MTIFSKSTSLAFSDVIPHAIVLPSICNESGRTRAFSKSTKCQNWPSIDAASINRDIATFSAFFIVILLAWGLVNAPYLHRGVTPF